MEESNNSPPNEIPLLFIGNLPPNAKENELEEYFLKLGPILSVRIPFNKSSGISKGVAYIQFANQEASQRAVNEYDQKPFNGRLLRVQFARPFSETEKKREEKKKLQLERRRRNYDQQHNSDDYDFDRRSDYPSSSGFSYHGNRRPPSSSPSSSSYGRSNDFESHGSHGHSYNSSLNGDRNKERVSSRGSSSSSDTKKYGRDSSSSSRGSFSSSGRSFSDNIMDRRGFSYRNDGDQGAYEHSRGSERSRRDHDRGSDRGRNKYYGDRDRYDYDDPPPVRIGSAYESSLRPPFDPRIQIPFQPPLSPYDYPPMPPPPPIRGWNDVHLSQMRGAPLGYEQAAYGLQANPLIETLLRNPDKEIIEMIKHVIDKRKQDDTQQSPTNPTPQ